MDNQYVVKPASRNAPTKERSANSQCVACAEVFRVNITGTEIRVSGATVTTSPKLTRFASRCKRGEVGRV